MSELKKRKEHDPSKDNSAEDPPNKLTRSFSIICSRLQKPSTPPPTSPSLLQLDISSAFFLDDPKKLETAFSNAIENDCLNLYYDALTRVLKKAEVPDIKPERNKVFRVLTAQAKNDPKLTKAILNAVNEFLFPKEKSEKKSANQNASLQSLVDLSLGTLPIKAMLAFKEKFKQVVFFSEKQFKEEPTENRETLSLTVNQN